MRGDALGGVLYFGDVFAANRSAESVFQMAILVLDDVEGIRGSFGLKEGGR